MTVSRYQLRETVINAHKMYEQTLIDRAVSHIVHYRTANLKHMSPEQMSNLHSREHIWKMGDRYEKLAQREYGDARMWWVIAWVNKAPAEFLLAVGDKIHIPTSLEQILSYLEV